MSAGYESEIRWLTVVKRLILIAMCSQLIFWFVLPVLDFAR